MGKARFTFSFAAAQLAWALASGPADAALVQYASQAAFQAATQSPLTQTYDTVGASAAVAALSGSTLNGISYSGGPLGIVDPANSLGATNWGTGAYLQFGSAAAVTLSFAPTTAFAALFGSNLGFQYDVAVSIDGGSFLTLATLSPTTLAFYGWTSDTPFSSVTIKGTESSPVLDNVTLAVASVPEPGTFSMMLAGLGLMGLAMRVRLRR
jgi:hypothetical protein